MAARPAAGPSGIRILDVDPAPAAPGAVPRAVVGEWVQVSATLARHGDERVTGLLRYRRAGGRRWLLAPLQEIGDGRWAGAFLADRPGRWQVQIAAWISGWEAWRAAVTRKVEGYGQQSYAAEIAEGRALLEPYREHPFVQDTLERVAGAGDDVLALVVLLGVQALPDQDELTALPRPLQVEVDPECARDGVWVELPGGRPGAAAAAVRRVAALGASTALLPATHALADGPDAVAGLAEIVAAAAAAGLRVAARVHVAADVAAGAGGGSGDRLAVLLAAWVGAGVLDLDVLGCEAVPIAAWEAAVGALRHVEPEAVVSAAGPAGPALRRALGGAGIAQAGQALTTVPGRDEAAALAAAAASPGTTLSARLRLQASGGAPLAVAAALADSFALVAPDGGGVMLLERLLELRRELPALRPGASVELLGTGDDRVLAVLRCSPFDEALVIAGRDREAAVETTVDIPAREGRRDAFAAVDLFADGEPTVECAAGPWPVSLPAGGFRIYRLER